MERFDAIVVGAGPAGSATAIRLAREGARVLLADRARFPRDKPCGGGVTGRAVRELPCAIDPVVEDVVQTLEVRLRYRKRFERRTERPLVLMTRRRRLDAFLAEQAVAAGTDFRDGVTVEGLTMGPDGAEPTVGGSRVQAPAIVGADGVNGTLARAAGLGGGIVYGIALEGNGPLQAGQQGRATVELGVVPGGYGWVFPKDGHANYGVGGWASEGPRLREHLHRLCAAHEVDLSGLTDLHGRRLPMRRTSAARRGPVLLVGDAAGLVDPLSGDGIYEALRLRSSRRRRDPRGQARRLRERAPRGARPLRRDVVEGEARARPSSPRRLRDRAPPSGVARDRRTRLRRPHSSE